MPIRMARDAGLAAVHRHPAFEKSPDALSHGADRRSAPPDAARCRIDVQACERALGIAAEAFFFQRRKVAVPQFVFARTHVV